MGLRELQRLINEGGRTRTEEQAFTQIRELSEIAMPRKSDVLRVPEAERFEESTASMSMWEAVLHPQGSRLGEPEPLDEETLEKWFALIQNEGGEVHLAAVVLDQSEPFLQGFFIQRFRFAKS